MIAAMAKMMMFRSGTQREVCEILFKLEFAAAAPESNYKPGPKFCAAITPPDKYEQALI